MSKPETHTNPDVTAEQRKADHIELAFRSQVLPSDTDTRFYYEPMLAGHPSEEDGLDISFLNKQMKAPVWVSSMTGGTKYANRINHNLAKACGEFGMGMGLGSCRQLLFEDTFLKDFSVRHLIGNYPLYANLGIAQIEELIDDNKLGAIKELLTKLEADGLIIHVNPMQEWTQPEGDIIKRSPIDSIKRVLDLGVPVIVKEVGQGFGPQSVKALLSLPLEAIDFGASGGTNFSILELFRTDKDLQEAFTPIAKVGHTAAQMVDFVNTAVIELGTQIQCKQVIVSGGIKNFLDGYYYINKLSLPAIYGQASSFLKYAREDYTTLQAHVQRQINGLKVANQFLTIRE